MIALVLGPDPATARAEVGRLARAHDPDGNSTTRVDGKTTPPAQIATMVGTPGFLGAGRVVIVDDLLGRCARTAAHSGSDDVDDAPMPGAAAEAARILEQVAPQNLLIVVDLSLAAVPAALKKSLPADTVVIRAEPPRGNELIAWLRRRAAEAGSEIDPATARELAEMLFPQTWGAKPTNPRYDRPPDLDLLGQEIDKLALAAHPGSIGRAHLTEMTERSVGDRTFPFVEAVAAGRLDAALLELTRLREAGEDPYRVAAQTYGQLELAAVLDGAGGRIDPVEVGRALGLPNPNRMIGIAKGLRRGTAAPAVARATAIDRASKRGILRQPEDALYALVAGAGTAGSQNQRGGR